MQSTAPSNLGTDPSPNRAPPNYFTLDSGPDGSPCPGATRPFNPGFMGASASNTAGAHTPFSLELTRPDGDQDLTALAVSTPPGFSATLAGIPYCSDAALATASGPATRVSKRRRSQLPDGIQIGTPNRGLAPAPIPSISPARSTSPDLIRARSLSLAVITPAVSGPYDLGNVVVRAALHVNPETAQITATSDPLPQILDGIPLRLRPILIELNRPNFTLNPTNCDPSRSTLKRVGDEGAGPNLGSFFQVSNCTDPLFAPELSLVSPDRPSTTAFPALSTDPDTNPGEANLARATLTLPHSEFLENAHIKDPCTRAQFGKDRSQENGAPPASDIGFAVPKAVARKAPRRPRLSARQRWRTEATRHSGRASWSDQHRLDRLCQQRR